MCPNGFYSLIGAPACLACPSGSYCPDATAAIPCASGTSSPTVGATSAAVCGLCPAVTYSSGGASECTLCARSTYTAGAGSSACTGPGPPTCSAGNYADPRYGTCTQCPAGSYFPAANTQWAPYQFAMETFTGTTSKGISVHRFKSASCIGANRYSQKNATVAAYDTQLSTFKNNWKRIFGANLCSDGASQYAYPKATHPIPEAGWVEGDASPQERMLQWPIWEVFYCMSCATGPGI